MGPGLPPISLDLETICLKSVEKEVAKRYSTAEEFADELRRYLDGEPIQARPISAGERLRRQMAKNRGLLVAAFVAFSMLVVMAGAVAVTLITTVDRTTHSLEQLDSAQAEVQADTLARAIGLNMLQGRADLARDLVNGLEKTEDVGSIVVLRLDQTPAYSDDATRMSVEKNLADPKHIAWINKRYPEFSDQIDTLRQYGFPNIDQKSRPAADEQLELRSAAWIAALSGEVNSYVDPKANERVILKPIFNKDECEICHVADPERKAGYGSNDTSRVRAVIVIRRPLDVVQGIIAENSRTTWLVGGATVLLLLLLVFLCAKVFGIGLPDRQFAERQGGES